MGLARLAVDVVVGVAALAVGEEAKAAATTRKEVAGEGAARTTSQQERSRARRSQRSRARLSSLLHPLLSGNPVLQQRSGRQAADMTPAEYGQPIRFFGCFACLSAYRPPTS